MMLLMIWKGAEELNIYIRISTLTSVAFLTGILKFTLSWVLGATTPEP
jgi:hypothetical protein